MAKYGSFTNSNSIGYTKNYYTETSSGKKYTVHVYKTNSSKQLIGPAVSTSYKTLSDLTIPNVTVTSKVNGNVKEYTGGPPFYGLFYTISGDLYFSGKKLNGASDIGTKLNSRSDPQFCVKNNGECIIKWCTNSSELQSTMNNVHSIIATTHPLVFTGTTTKTGTTKITDSVFKSEIWASDGIRVANGSNFNDINCHFNGNTLKGQIDTEWNRTFIGHIPGGSYVMVVADTEMTLMTGAKIMYDLGCDFAGNLDGGPASQMIVGGVKKSTTGTASYTQGTAICAYNI